MKADLLKIKRKTFSTSDVSSLPRFMSDDSAGELSARAWWCCPASQQCITATLMLL